MNLQPHFTVHIQSILFIPADQYSHARPFILSFQSVKTRSVGPFFIGPAGFCPLFSSLSGSNRKEKLWQAIWLRPGREREEGHQQKRWHQLFSRPPFFFLYLESRSTEERRKKVWRRLRRIGLCMGMPIYSFFFDGSYPWYGVKLLIFLENTVEIISIVKVWYRTVGESNQTLERFPK